MGGRSVSTTVAGRGTRLLRPISWKPSTAAHPSTETSATATVNLAGEELWDAVGL